MFFLIPADGEDTVEASSVILGEDGTMTPVEELYSGDGSPVLIRCLAADFYADVSVTLKDPEGDVIGEFMPYLSGKDGSVVIEEDDAGKPIFRDLTDYENIVQ